MSFEPRVTWDVSWALMLCTPTSCTNAVGTVIRAARSSVPAVVLIVALLTVAEIELSASRSSRIASALVLISASAADLVILP